MRKRYGGLKISNMRRISLDVLQRKYLTYASLRKYYNVQKHPNLLFSREWELQIYAEREDFTYCIERASITGKNITLEGWALSSSKSDLHIEIEVTSRAGTKHLPVDCNIERQDVVEARNLSASTRPGFRANMKPLPYGIGSLKLLISDAQHLTAIPLFEYDIGSDKAGAFDLSLSILKHGASWLMSADARKVRFADFAAQLCLEAPTWPTGRLADFSRYASKQHFNVPNLADPVDIVIACFNNLHLVRPLMEDIFANTDVKCRVILVDDGSKDQQLHEYYDELLEKEVDNIKIEVIKLEKNSGFIKASNAGLAISVGHVVLLNTDTRLPPNWLSRLIAPICHDDNIASVTPFTNGGTVASFPRTLVDNPLFLGLSVTEIDKIFVNFPQNAYFEIPSGVGFCMALNRRFINEIGYLDEGFGRGYAEENDWSCRAKNIGGKNILIPNLFIYHIHGATFKDDKIELLNKNLRLLGSKHPWYFKAVDEYIALDPTHDLRVAALLRTLSTHPDRALLIFDHDLGGGANRYRDQRIMEAVKSDKLVILIQPDTARDVFNVTAFWSGENMRVKTKGLAGILDVVGDWRDVNIIVNDLVSYENPIEMAKIFDALQTAGARFEILHHDYFFVCPSYTLLNEKNMYCGVPSAETCVQCAKVNANFGRYSGQDPVAWRDAWRGVITAAAENVVFSQSGRSIISQAWPGIENVVVRPHRPNWLPTRVDIDSSDQNIKRLGVIGGINHAKGSGVIRELCEYVDRTSISISIFVIGTVYPEIVGNSLLVTGKYSTNELESLVTQYETPVILIPSIWPETYSYVADEAMAMGLGIVCFDVGAAAERVREYPFGVIAANTTPAAVLEAAQLAYSLWRQSRY